MLLPSKYKACSCEIPPRHRHPLAQDPRCRVPAVSLDAQNQPEPEAAGTEAEAAEALDTAPQEVFEQFEDRRIIAGRIETGRIDVGEEIVVMPSGRTATAVQPRPM